MAYLPWLYPHLVALTSEGRKKVLTRGLRAGGSVYVVPRGMCQYSRKAMPRTDAKGREAARQQTRFESRFAEPEVIAQAHVSTPTPGDVIVWAWDRALVEQLVRKKDVRALPETLARQGMRSGVRIVEGLDGYEGEIWADGELVASRWWADPPQLDAWQDFLVGARMQFPGADLWDMDLPHMPPEPVRPQWKQNIASVDDNWKATLARVTPVRAAVIVGVLALAPAACQTARFAKLSVESQILNAQIEDGRAKAAAWLAQQRRAQRDAQFVNVAQGVGDDVALMFALIDAGDVLQNEGQTIQQLRYVDRQISLTLTGRPQTNLSQLITKLEATPSWRDVRMEQGGTLVVGRVEEGRAAEKAARVTTAPGRPIGETPPPPDPLAQQGGQGGPEMSAPGVPAQPPGSGQ